MGALGYVGYKMAYGGKKMDQNVNKAGVHDQSNIVSPEGVRTLITTPCRYQYYTMNSGKFVIRDVRPQSFDSFCQWFPDYMEKLADCDTTRPVRIYERSRVSFGFACIGTWGNIKVFVVKSTDPDARGGVYSKGKKGSYFASDNTGGGQKWRVEIQMEFIPRSGDIVTRAVNGSEDVVTYTVASYDEENNLIHITKKGTFPLSISPEDFNLPSNWKIEPRCLLSQVYKGAKVITQFSDNSVLQGTLNGCFKMGGYGTYWLWLTGKYRENGKTESATMYDGWLDARDIGWVCGEKIENGAKLQLGHYMHHKTLGDCVVIEDVQDVSTVMVQLGSTGEYQIIPRNNDSVDRIYRVQSTKYHVTD